MSELREEIRKDLNQKLGLREDVGEEIRRMSFGETFDWSIKRDYNPIGQPTWFAVLEPKPEDTHD